MFNVISFSLIQEIKTQDSTGQTTSTTKETQCIGQQKSVYSDEFYKAEEAGLRARGMVQMSAFDYNGETRIKIDNVIYSIYRIYREGTDKVELYYADRAGT